MLPPKDYRFEVRDLSDGTFQIEITRMEGEGDFFQLTPFTYNNSVLPALPVVDLEIPLLDPKRLFGIWCLN